ncbi:hypothetical protein GYMLUDRAFT_42311 [Collybiopsis luxurians FD-317 M1]|uniref:Uncharacterized protein n=1 Tax=Collybiopsis luxurians FD-317 M1 TaxID=944289 RepID=A0A0D0BDT1_9AGAR|nr:hypothetical protein GYMLUDRAFT_42311 [Collybiopsis luxurians FD-317 M1]
MSTLASWISSPTRRAHHLHSPLSIHIHWGKYLSAPHTNLLPISQRSGLTQTKKNFLEPHRGSGQPGRKVPRVYSIILKPNRSISRKKEGKAC